MLSKGKAKKNQRKKFEQKMCDRTFLFLAELTENVESGSHFSFFGGLNFEQVPVRAYRNCGEWIALFSFFLGGGLNLEQVLCGGSTALFFFLGGLNLEQVPGRAYRKCGGSTALFFFLGSEPGTGARPSLQKMWRERGIGIADFS